MTPGRYNAFLESWRLWALAALLVPPAASTPLFAYAPLTHEAIVDTAWDDGIAPGMEVAKLLADEDLAIGTFRHTVGSNAKPVSAWSNLDRFSEPVSQRHPGASPPDGGDAPGWR